MEWLNRLAEHKSDRNELQNNDILRLIETIEEVEKYGVDCFSITHFS